MMTTHMAAGFAAGMARRYADEVMHIMGRFALRFVIFGQGGGVAFWVVCFGHCMVWGFHELVTQASKVLWGVPYIFVKAADD